MRHCFKIESVVGVVLVDAVLRVWVAQLTQTLHMERKSMMIGDSDIENNSPVQALVLWK